VTLSDLGGHCSYMKPFGSKTAADVPRISWGVPIDECEIVRSYHRPLTNRKWHCDLSNVVISLLPMNFTVILLSSGFLAGVRNSASRRVNKKQRIERKRKRVERERKSNLRNKNILIRTSSLLLSLIFVMLHLRSEYLKRSTNVRRGEHFEAIIRSRRF